MKENKIVKTFKSYITDLKGQIERLTDEVQSETLEELTSKQFY